MNATLVRRWQVQPPVARGLVLATAAALTVAAALWLGVAPGWLAEAEQADEAALTTRRQAQRQARTVLPALAALPTWRASLPEAADSDARLAAMMDAALHQGVALGRQQQQWRAVAPAVGSEPAVAALQLTQQAEAPYAALRAWVAQALAEDPQLLLDSLRLQRSSPASAQVTAELQWTLLHRAGAQAVAP